MNGDAESAAVASTEDDRHRRVDLSRTLFSPGASSLLPEGTARRYRAVPIERNRRATVVAVAESPDQATIEAIRAAVGGGVVIVSAPVDQVDAAIARIYGRGPIRTSRRRGQHEAFADARPDGPGNVDGESEIVDEYDHTSLPFATADGLLAGGGASGSHSGELTDGRPGSPPTSLEEALRDVLAAPEVDHGSPPIPLAAFEALGHAETSEAPPSGDDTGVGAVPPPGQTGAAIEGPPPAATNGTISQATTNGAIAPGFNGAAPATNGAASPTNGATAPSASNGNGTLSVTGYGPSAVSSTPPQFDAAVSGTVTPAVAPAAESTSSAEPLEATALVQPELAEPQEHTGTAEPAEAAEAAEPAGIVEVAQPTSALPSTEITSPDIEQPPSTSAPSVVHDDAPSGTVPASPAAEPPTQPGAPVLPAGPRSTAGAPPPPPPGYGEVVNESAMAATDLHWPPLARVLVTLGKVSFEDMVAALRTHRDTGESLARYLYNNQLATEDDLVQAMAEEVGLEFVDLSTFPVDPAVASLVPESVARRHMVLPVRIEQGVPVVAMANPTDVFAMDDLRSIMGRNFAPVVATRTQIAAHLRSLQEPDTDVEEAAQSAAGVMAPGAGGGFELESLQSVVEDAPIVRYVNLLILQALNERASDIHIEPSPRRLRIRFRIDGVMHDASSAAPAIHPSVVSRLKVLGDMDITEHRIPQEGRVSVSVGDRQIDLRLATIPSLYGETCVMRLLDKSASIRRLSELGFLADTLDRYAIAYNHPYGVILVTGPTGAGKTTTLYATLHEVMSKEKSVVTVEDPVEYQIDGITQMQINPKAGLQFSTALRSILRADPDIILVGEIRDIETATIAMEAALSGHLVLTTLHTNTAAATPLRLTEMGIEPFLVTSAVSGVLTQRLARVLCERCKTPYDASLADFYAAGYREVDLEGLDTTTLWRANGCRSCSHTGYHGRMVLAEVMQVTEEIERMIIEQQSIVAMERQAVEQGMRTLRQDGLRKAIAGMTTLEEVLRVVV